jgi:hypothetical protein
MNYKDILVLNNYRPNRYTVWEMVAEYTGIFEYKKVKIKTDIIPENLPINLHTLDLGYSKVSKIEIFQIIYIL